MKNQCSRVNIWDNIYLKYFPANTCPLGYKYNRTLQFCYLDLDIRFDYDGGTAYCESIGSRLAIVPTRKHHIHLREGRWCVYFIRADKILKESVVMVENSWSVVSVSVYVDIKRFRSYTSTTRVWILQYLFIFWNRNLFCRL